MVKESIGVFEVLVERKNGADGEVSVHYKTSDINARAGKDYEGMLEMFSFPNVNQKKQLIVELCIMCNRPRRCSGFQTW